MKKIHIALLILIAGSVAYMLISMSGDLTTYDSIVSARKKQGKFVHLIAELDRDQPIVYDPIKDPNFLEFYAEDSLGGRTRVVYYNAKPPELEVSEKIVMTGKMKGDVFECKEILLKCPSKYKDDPTVQKKALDGKSKQAY